MPFIVCLAVTAQIDNAIAVLCVMSTTVWTPDKDCTELPGVVSQN